MIVGKQIDSAIIGRSYLSFLFGISQINNGEASLIIDDNRVKYGNLWPSYFGEIEKEYLKLWGETNGITALANIDKYISNCPVTLVVDQKRVHLTGNPYRNFKELARKFHHFFGVESLLSFNFDAKIFNQSYLNFLNRVAEISLKFKSFQTIDASVFKEASCPEYNLMFDLFVKKYNRPIEKTLEQSIEQRLFVMLCRALYQGKITDSISEFELSHLMASLCSPFYHLDEHALNEDLKRQYSHKFGGLKRTTISAWETYKGELGHLQLSSFEGIIKPKRTFFLGETHHEIPLKVLEEKKAYHCIEVSIVRENFFAGNENHRILYTGKELLGTDLPLLDVKIKSQHEAMARIPFPRTPGNKASFYKGKVIEMIYDFFENYFYERPNEKYFIINVRESTDMWTGKDASQHLFTKNHKSSTKQGKMVSIKGPQTYEKVSQVEYWGILNHYPLGLLSLFMEMKEKH